MDKRRFLPELWLPEASTPGRSQGAGPTEAAVQTTPPLAAAMVPALHAAGLFPCRSLGAACLYGHRPEFWAAWEAGVGTVACGARPEDTRGGLQPLAPQLRPDQ